jgi:type III secretion system low calcium response chaperone LcrH/SycD
MAERVPPSGKQDKLPVMLQRWAEGKATLKEVRGYSDEELYAISKTAYFFFYQGRVEEARTVFHGLYALSPQNPYFAKALGVVEMAAGNASGALAAYDVAVRLAPSDAAAYVGRAEVRLSLGQRGNAADDLKVALQNVKTDDPLKAKIDGMLEMLSEKSRAR